jgi:hypothetical protein
LKPDYQRARKPDFWLHCLFVAMRLRRITTLFRETNHLILRDEVPYFGRRFTLNGETNHLISGDDLTPKPLNLIPYRTHYLLTYLTY